ncbi:MAG: protein kinase [Elainellaceae cyanobacterium]
MVSSNMAIPDTELFDYDPQVLLGGRYQIIKQLAEGTFGHTYLARDWHLPDHPICVIKQLKPQSNGEEMKTAQRLFDAEARALYALGSHGQIPHLLAHFVEHEEFFLVQEYIKGRSLNNEIVAGAPWSESRVIDLMEEILEVLSFVHQQQVIHRDIKPANLIRRYSDGRVVLIDFGAVKLASTPFSNPTVGETELTIAIGTAGYIPKEQVGGRPRKSSDVYSTGIVGIQALTGIPPQQFTEDRWSGELEWRGLAPHVSPEFAQVLDRMTRYDFRDRYVDAAAALDALKQLPLHLRQQSISSIPGIAEPSMMPMNGASLPPTVVHSTDLPSQSPQGVARANTPAETAVSVPPPSSHPTPSPITPNLPVSGPPLPNELQAPDQISDSAAGYAASTEGALPQYQSAYPSSPNGHRRHHPEPKGELMLPGGTWFQGATAFAQWHLMRWRQKRLYLWYLAGLVGLMSGFSALPLLSRQSLSVSANHINTDRLLDSAELLVQQVPIQDTLDSNVSLRSVRLISEAARLEASDQYAGALEAYRTALALDSANLDALQGRCRMLNALGQGEMALDACNDLLVVNAADPTGQWGIAKANSTMAFYDKALELFDQALEQHPDFPPLQKDRAELLRQMGNSGLSSPP